MKKTTVMIIQDSCSPTKQYGIPTVIFKILFVGSFLFAGLIGFLCYDYVQLLQMRLSYNQMAAENEGIKSEARALVSNIKEVKESLARVQDYTQKLTQITNVKVNKVTKSTGMNQLAIGPLNAEEYEIAKKRLKEEALSSSHMSMNLDDLMLKSSFVDLKDVQIEAELQVVDLQKILSVLSSQKSLLSSVPSIAPTSGWIASPFGHRVSPFTGIKQMHQGLDIAAPIGTPVYAPADGVVIYEGKKSGYGNFLMIAHGYGIVTRYGHTSQNMVVPGQRVVRGEQIATVGMTGRTTGPHLHYEVVVNGVVTNPNKFILNFPSDISDGVGLSMGSTGINSDSNSTN